MLKRLIVLIDGMDVFRRPADTRFAEAGQYGLNDPLAQDQHTGQDANAIGAKAVTSASLDAFDERLTAQFREVVTGVARGVAEALVWE